MKISNRFQAPAALIPGNGALFIYRIEYALCLDFLVHLHPHRMEHVAFCADKYSEVIAVELNIITSDLVFKLYRA
jgi:hypothetical protein